MFEPVRIAPSILSANFMCMDESIQSIENNGADLVHIDVMDGHFVPNITIGVPFVKQLRNTTHLPLDVHLMVSNPVEQIPWFIEAGADILNFHFEPYAHDPRKIEQSIALIKDANCRVAMTCKPTTPIDCLKPYICELDMVLVMSVNPGFSGQPYIEGSEHKVAEVVEMARTVHASPLIQVDGGIGIETAAKVSAMGADVLVAGNAVFKSPSIEEAIARIRRSAMEAR